MCSRKHFRIAAKQVRNIELVEIKRAVASEFIKFFENISEKFDRERFWSACGLNDYLLEV